MAWALEPPAAMVPVRLVSRVTFTAESVGEALALEVEPLLLGPDEHPARASAAMAAIAPTCAIRLIFIRSPSLLQWFARCRAECDGRHALLPESAVMVNGR
ncbi:hypothetical protein GCM10023087_17460 [Microbacterium rhizosphaerae]